ncbi:MAG: ArsA family ATPase [Candidatus Heimdallarchaeaceae archaeon]
MTLDDLLTKTFKFILVGGKGGVGKTTVASSLAIKIAETGKKVLLISTDPAHSISDSFDMDFSSGQVTKVKGTKNLFALEINPAEASEELSKALGTSVTSDQITNVFGMQGLQELQGLGDELQSIPPPGMDEALSFAKILEYAEDEDFDTIILDTAPTGHTLRLLNIPEFLDSFLGRMLKMRTFISNALNMFKSLFGSKQEKDHTMEVLEAMKEKVLIARDQLMDPEQTQFIIVMIPTLMSIFESERLIDELNQHLIPHSNIIINMVNPDNPECPYCTMRRKEHMKNIDYIRSAFTKHNINIVEAFAKEIRGVKILKEFGTKLFEK